MKPEKPLSLVRPLSPEEQQAFGELALALLNGVHLQDRNGLPKLVPLSSDTEPTETQGRVALSALLLSMADDYPVKDNRHGVLVSLASTFVPRVSVSRPSPFKAILKRHSQGHSDAYRDFVIAREVCNLRRAGDSYDGAISKTAKKLDREERHIKKIYARWRRYLEPQVASDKRTGDMSSDR